MSPNGFSLDATKTIGDLERLETKVQRKLSRRAVGAGGRVINREAKSEAPVGETKNLKKSHGVKTKVYAGSNTAVALVGPRVSGAARGYHGHLVHNGHIAADGSFVPGNPYLKRAVDQSGGRAQDAMAKKLGDDIEQEAGR